VVRGRGGTAGTLAAGAGDGAPPPESERMPSEVRRCRFTVSKPELKARLVSALETIRDEALSSVAFNLNARRYSEGVLAAHAAAAGAYTRSR
jgi:hypothetical protein